MNKPRTRIIALARQGLTPAVRLCLGLGVLGGLAVFNATFHLADPLQFVIRHFGWLLAATLPLLLASCTPARWLRQVGVGGAIFFYFLLLASLFFGFGVGGTRGWFSWRGLLIQPAEIGKPFFVLALAMIMQQTRPYRKDWLTGCLPPFLLLLAWLIPLFLQPDLGAVLVYTLTFSLVFFCLGGSPAQLGLSLLSGLPFFALILRFGPLLANRLQSPAEINQMADSAGWHVAQFQHALASGGLLGQAMGQTLESRFMLPPGHSASIFATLGESMGLLGLASLLLILMAWVVYGYQRSQIAAAGGDDFQVGAIIGLTSLLAVQACLHLSINTGLLPAIDIQLPLLSYGGSSLVAVFLTVGLVESLVRQIPDED